MRWLVIYLMGLGVAASGAQADPCPPAPDHQAELAALTSEVQQAKTEGAARQITNQMWALWADAPDEPAQAALDHGMRLRRSYDLLGAVSEFDRLVDYCPHYAEGYNQRAFAHFLRQDFAASLMDLDRAIALSPNHIAALGGRALSLLGLGRVDDARTALTKALALNPWLPERSLADPSGPLAPKGETL
ncbi:MAG: tetratricopeptide (TPR) repeat protein [Paracoccaceae bacterium]|jgi:tetratricopeptide (TPR) repeat protein